MKIRKIISGLKYFDLATIILWISGIDSVKKYLGACRLEYYNQRKIGLPVRKFWDVFPDCRQHPTSVKVLTEEITGGLSTRELVFLSSIVKCYPIKSIFEIGTFDGCAAAHMMFNSQLPDQCHIYTLDLPPEKVQDYSHDPDNKEFLALRRPGYYISRYTTSGITQLFGDSLKFDFSPYFNAVDLVFVDGNHNAPYIQSDTANALKMLKAGGFLIWHDYFGIPGEPVTDYLNHLSGSFPIQRIKNTCLAVYHKNEQ